MNRPLSPPALRLVPPPADPPDPHPDPRPSGEALLWAAIREPGPYTAWLLGLNLGGEAS